MVTSLKKLKLASLLGISLYALTACGGSSNVFTISRNSPDEFTVVKRAPLTLPPDYELRPPRPGEARPQERDARSQARSAVTGGTAAAAATGASEGEMALLNRANVDEANADIRSQINQETQDLYDNEDSVVKDILFWSKQDPSTVVDAGAEARRIEQAEESGENIADGETPIIERRSQGLFD